MHLDITVKGMRQPPLASGILREGASFVYNHQGQGSGVPWFFIERVTEFSHRTLVGR